MAGASNGHFGNPSGSKKGHLDEDAVYPISSPPFIHIDKKRLRHVRTNKYLTVKDDKPILRTLKSCEEDQAFLPVLVHAWGEEDSPDYTPCDKKVQVFSFVADNKYISYEKGGNPTVELRSSDVEVEKLCCLKTEHDPIYFYAYRHQRCTDLLRFRSTMHENHFLTAINDTLQLTESSDPDEREDIHFELEPP